MSANGIFPLYVICVVIFCTTISVSNGSNILVIAHIGVPSHVQFLSAAIDELIPRGHNVTYLGVLPYTGHFKLNVTQHLLKSDIVNIEHSTGIKKLMQDAINPSVESSPLSSILATVKVYGEEPCTFLESNIITNIMNSTTTFEAILLDIYLGECFYSIAYMKKIPLILLSSSLVLPWYYSCIGIDPYFGIEKSFFLNYPQDNIYYRTLDLLKGYYLTIYRYWVFASAIDSWLLKNYPHIKFPPFYELEKNVSLLMINSIPEMGYARIESSLVVNIGGLHIRSSKKIPSELESFISAAEDKGFIYFSLGSTFQTEVIPKYLLDIFLEAFKQLPYRVLMKWNNNSIAVPSNVLVSHWLPQQDILADSRLRVFITQGGIFSLQEAVYHGVPVIVIPIICDQFTNAGEAEKLGYGVKLDIKTVNAPLLVNAIQKVVNQPRFKTIAQKISSIARDTPSTPRQRFSWWVEYVIRNGGTECLQTAVQKLFWFQQKQLDVLALLILVGVVLILFLYLSISLTYKFIRISISKERKQKEP